MKKITSAAFLILLMSCNSGDSSTKTTTADSTQTDVGRVENVNGNIPDTTLSGATPNSKDNASTHIDSTYADTTKNSKKK
jgi:hypothetical protein